MQAVLDVVVASLKGVKVVGDFPSSGTLTQVTIHWPEGCSSLVEVAVGIGKDTWVCPRKKNTFIALDRSTTMFQTNEQVKTGDIFWAVIRNRDDSNKHEISVIGTLV